MEKIRTFEDVLKLKRRLKDSPPVGFAEARDLFHKYSSQRKEVELDLRIIRQDITFATRNVKRYKDHVSANEGRPFYSPPQQPEADIEKLQRKRERLAKNFQEITALRDAARAAMQPYFDRQTQQVAEAYQERLEQIKAGKFHDETLEGIAQTIDDETKISVKDKTNLVAALEIASWEERHGLDHMTGEASYDIPQSWPDIYIFGSSLKRRIYRDIDLVVDSEDFITRLRRTREHLTGTTFKTLFEKHAGIGYSLFLHHGEYRVKIPGGDLKRFGKTNIHLIYPSTPLEELQLGYELATLTEKN